MSIDRWLTLGASVVMESVSGSAYAFSVYGPQLKSQLNYTQADTNGIAAWGDLGLYISLPGGLLFDAVGPGITAGIAAVGSGMGYLLLHLGATQRIAHSPFAMAGYAAMAWHFSGYLDTVAVAANVRNFGPNKGLVLGLIKSLFGLSASLLSLAYASLYKPDVNSFLLFLAIIIPAVTLPLAPLLRLVDATPLLHRAERTRVVVGYCGVVGTAAYLVAVSLLQGRGVIDAAPGYAYALVALVGAQLLIAAPTCAGRAGRKSLDDDEAGAGKARRDDDIDGDGAIQVGLLGGKAAGGEDEGDSEAAERGGGGGGGRVETGGYAGVPGARFVRGMFSADFALLMLVLFAGSGAGLTVINNLGSLVQSLGAPADGQDVYVSLLSVSNCFGRIFFGWASDAYSHRLSRPGWTVVLCLSMAGALAVMSFATLDSLYVGAMWVGFSYGGWWSVGPAVIAERYGGRAFASLVSLVNISTAVASYALNSGLAAGVYAAHTPDGSNTCLGLACFQATFITLGALNVASAGLAVWLSVRLRPLYDAQGKPAPYALFRPDGETGAVGNAVDAALARVACCRRCGAEPSAL